MAISNLHLHWDHEQIRTPFVIKSDSKMDLDGKLRRGVLWVGVKISLELS